MYGVRLNVPSASVPRGALFPFVWVIKWMRVGLERKTWRGSRNGSWNMKGAPAAVFSASYLQLYARYSIFACAHCSPGLRRKQSVIFRLKQCSSLSIRAWNNWLQPSARIAIIDHVCDVCLDPDSESLFNTDEWLPLKPVDFFSADFDATQRHLLGAVALRSIYIGYRFDQALRHHRFPFPPECRKCLENSQLE